MRPRGGGNRCRRSCRDERRPTSGAVTSGGSCPRIGALTHPAVITQARMYPARSGSDWGDRPESPGVPRTRPPVVGFAACRRSARTVRLLGPDPVFDPLGLGRGRRVSPARLRQDARSGEEDPVRRPGGIHVVDADLDPAHRARLARRHPDYRLAGARRTRGAAAVDPYRASVRVDLSSRECSRVLGFRRRGAA